MYSSIEKKIHRLFFKIVIIMHIQTSSLTAHDNWNIICFKIFYQIPQVCIRFLSHRFVSKKEGKKCQNTKVTSQQNRKRFATLPKFEETMKAFSQHLQGVQKVSPYKKKKFLKSLVRLNIG